MFFIFLYYTMSKKEKPENTKAKEYLDNYTSKIHQKFLDQKKDKELFEIMEMSPAEKEKEYTKIKEDMKRFIEELKSDENYDKMKKIYHENMQKVHSFNKLLHDYNKELEIKDMKKHIQQGKEKIFDINTKKREIFVKSYKKIRDKLPESEKKNIIKELDKLMNDHEYFRKTTASFIEKIREINWKEVLVKDEF